MAEVLAHAGHIGPEVMNCSAPDTGNMGAPYTPILQPNSYICSHVEVLARYGSPEQQQKWLIPLLNGEIRSAFAMTEKNGLSTNSLL
jgi:acyl-CoA dehydrogenase